MVCAGGSARAATASAVVALAEIAVAVFRALGSSLFKDDEESENGAAHALFGRPAALPVLSFATGAILLAGVVRKDKALVKVW